jgi:hypothetical protein
MNLAPIVLFVYNRPKHTKNLLDSLANNKESKDSILYIYCDGPKQNSSNEIRNLINDVREIVKCESRFKEIIIIENEINKGLANSIIEGVTNVVNNHGRVIVLEDDLILSNYFLYYMNDSLERYENIDNIGQIGGCNFFSNKKNIPPTIFLPIPDCLGWATWKSRWVHFEKNSQTLLNLLLENPDKKEMFNLYGHYNSEEMLVNQVQGNGNSWAIRWQATCVLNNWLTLYPNPSVTNHIHSNDATHANFDIMPPLLQKKINYTSVKPSIHKIAFELMKLGYSKKVDYFGKRKNSYLKTKVKNIISYLNRFLSKQ